MTGLKSFIRKSLLARGYDIRRVDPNQLGRDPFEDMSRLTGAQTGAIVFDVGANIGQTIASFRSHFASPMIHAFEPGPSAFEQLKQRTMGTPDLRLNNLALGSRPERKVLLENAESSLSSFLPQGKDFCWQSDTTARAEVDVSSLDAYCDAGGIPRIHVLKSDTQGFDLEVLKGGSDMLRRHKVHLIFIELNWYEAYADLPRFEEVHLYLKDLGFRPVCFYNQAFLDSRLAWLDGLYVDPEWQGA